MHFSGCFGVKWSVHSRLFPLWGSGFFHCWIKCFFQFLSAQLLICWTKHAFPKNIKSSLILLKRWILLFGAFTICCLQFNLLWRRGNSSGFHRLMFGPELLRRDGTGSSAPITHLMRGSTLVFTSRWWKLDVKSHIPENQLMRKSVFIYIPSFCSDCFWSFWTEIRSITQKLTIIWTLWIDYVTFDFSPWPSCWYQEQTSGISRRENKEWLNSGLGQRPTEDNNTSCF